jgi:queuine tRNA-ribosyltransferase
VPATTGASPPSSVWAAQHLSHFTFELDTPGIATGPRRGRLLFARGVVETPAFMPVGTQATVKTLEPHEVEALGAEIVLSNTYHLMLRPGMDLIRQAGGLHEFMRWNRPILTDSGGFQVFSLASQVRVRDEGVTFRSHLDGSAWFLTPEEAMRLQAGYGSDIMMALDHVVGLPCTRRKVAEAATRTHEWLQRCAAAHREIASAGSVGALFGIAQGGLEEDLRRESAHVIAEADVAGCAIGGLSVGETKEAMNAMLEVTTPHLPI